VSHYTDSYDQHVSVPGDGQAGGYRARRWLVLAAGTVAVTAGSTFQYGLAYLIPAPRTDGLSLAQAGVIVACPTAGLLLTLIAWGAAADRWGGRLILTSGLGMRGTDTAGGHPGPRDGGARRLPGGGRSGRGSGVRGQRAAHPGWFAARQRGLAMASGRPRSRWGWRSPRSRCRRWRPAGSPSR
jgi:hypothetical protein